MKHIITSLFLFCFFINNTIAQSVEITSNGYSGNVVVGQSVYHASESNYYNDEIGSSNFLTSATAINSIEFYISETTTVSLPITISSNKIYIKNSSDSSISSGTYSLAGYTLVYNGQISWAKKGWNKILLQTPFIRTSGSNLKILILRNSTPVSAGIIFNTANGHLGVDINVLSSRRYNSTVLPAENTTSLIASSFRPAIKLKHISNTDVEASSLKLPDYTCISTPQNIEATISNVGFQNIAANVPINLSLNVSGANTGTYNFSYSGGINKDSSISVIFNNINLNNLGNNVIQFTATIAGDSSLSDNVLTKNWKASDIVTDFPATENATKLTLFSNTKILKGSRNLWTRASGGYANMDLSVPSDSLHAKDGEDFFVFDSWSPDSSNGFRGLLYSSCISIPAQTNVNNGQYDYNCNFWMTHDTSYSTDLDSMYLCVSNDKGKNWNRIAGFQRYDPNFVICRWKKETVSLAAYNGQTIQLGFEGVSKYGNIIGIDKISVMNDFSPKISGTVYVDLNGNNVMDSTDYPKVNTRLNLSNGDYTFTDNFGNYYFEVDTLGNYACTTKVSNLFTANPSITNYTFNKYDTSVVTNVALHINNNVDSAKVVLTPVFWAARPGFAYPYYVSYENVGTSVLAPVININYDTSKLIFDSLNNSSNLTNLYNGTLTKTGIGNIYPGFIHTIYVPFKVKASAPLSSNITTAANLIQNQNQLSTDTSKVRVRGSYDPNDKQATPELTPVQVSLEKPIEYTIRFQNTGNDTAFNITIADTLSSLLQANTLQIISSSHTCHATVKDKAVSFYFDNILLPDSNVNVIGSNGFVKFTVKPQTNLSLGTIIPNLAYIYFDYNSPIITNIATTTIKFPTVVTPLKLVSYNVSLLNQKKVISTWQTTNEINVSHFNIQRSINGKDFITIGKVNASCCEYHFIDDKLPITHDKLTLNYRLEIVDKDGSKTYSTTQQIIIQPQISNIVIYPNPATSTVNIECTNVKELMILDYLGKTAKQFNHPTDHQTLNTKQLTKGVYIVKAMMNNGEVKTEKLIVE